MKQRKGLTSFFMLFAPIVSMAILTIGNGFFTTLTTIQLNTFKAPTWLIGLISAAYFAGLFVGSYRTQKIIIRVKHIRAYALFASILAVASLAQGLINNNIAWFILRYICGYCVAGLFITIESWCLEGSAPEVKGFIFAIYLFSYYLAQGLGQLLLRINYSSMLIPFCIIAGTASLSIVPVCVTRFETPMLKATKPFSPLTYIKRVPLGVMGSFISGLVLGGIYTLFPLTLTDLNFSINQIAYLMWIVIFGGTIFQLPIGKLSDLFDRRIILALVGLSCVLLSLVLLFVHTVFWQVMLLVFFLGGSAFVIYPLSISHATDYTDKSETVQVLATVSLVYGVGSMLGPIIISNLMHWVGPNAIFLFNIAVCFFLSIYAVWRLIRHKKISEDEKVSFVAATQNMVVGAEKSLGEQLYQNRDKG